MKTDEGITPETLAPDSVINGRVGQVADSAIVTWVYIDGVLAPIIGQRGMTALFKRSLYLASHNHPWLMTVHDNTILLGQFSHLHAALSQQTSRNAAIANDNILWIFHILLNSFIGKNLVKQLLHPIFNQSIH